MLLGLVAGTAPAQTPAPVAGSAAAGAIVFIDLASPVYPGMAIYAYPVPAGRPPLYFQLAPIVFIDRLKPAYPGIAIYAYPAQPGRAHLHFQLAPPRR